MTLAMARAFIPPGKNGHVLLTTRAQAAGAIARRVEIQEMGTEEGALFLLRRAKYIVEDALLEAAARPIGRRQKKLSRNSMASLWPLTKPAPTSRRRAVGSRATWICTEATRWNFCDVVGR